MDALFVILFLVIIIFIIYVVYSFNNRGFSSYSSHEIWKSYPGKYEGFVSMSPSPVDSPSPESYNKLDPFGLIGSSMDCPGSSYSNLNGNICLNDNQKMLLTTRGGNSKTGTKYETA
jgi:hypothetical protein